MSVQNARCKQSMLNQLKTNPVAVKIMLNTSQRDQKIIQKRQRKNI